MRRFVVLTVGLLTFGGCARESSSARSAGVAPTLAGTPQQFAALREEVADSSGRDECPTRLRAGHDTSLILLQRSVRNERRRTEGAVTRVLHLELRGDYSVIDPSRFRMQRGKWLRINCLTLKPLGVVDEVR